jgi:16S rRNA (cytidine1402-2'-O)-methyltransferase
LGDLSARAIEILATADVVYCEDTRRSRTLFAANGLDAAGRLDSLHQHNEASQCDEVVARVRAGQLVALVSDAGTPGISDPGQRVVAAVADAGLRVTTAPGPSAVIAALSISGLPTDRFAMDGFVPRKQSERLALFRRWLVESRTVVFYESPQRIGATMSDLAGVVGERRVALCRELTKLHEEVLRGTVAEVAAQLERRGEVLGEIAVVLEGVPEPTTADVNDVSDLLARALDRGATVKEAVALVVEVTGAVHREVYDVALTMKRERRP